MWIGSIRLRVKTKDETGAGTDNLVVATVCRDERPLLRLKLDYPNENDLEPGSVRDYDYVGPDKLKRNFHRTLELPADQAGTKPPYPGWGLEYSDGLKGHLTLRVEIRGDDKWVKHSVDMFIRELRRGADGVWREDRDWTYVATWGRDVPMSTDTRDGTTVLKLNFA